MTISANDLKDKRAIITGASEGLGFAIANLFCKMGADVFIISRSQEKIDAAANKLQSHNTNIHTLTADMSDSKQIQHTSQQILNKWDHIDILVNNAGYAQFGPFEEISISDIQYLINLNLMSTIVTTQSLMPALIKGKASIINLSSYYAHRITPFRPGAIYTMCKAGVSALTKSLATELGPHHIRVNAIAPGMVETDHMKQRMQALSPVAHNKTMDFIGEYYPLQRMGTPEEIANAALYLASNASSWTTGLIMHVDGGAANT
ncbi:SDR family oxidoreductase [Planctomycetota bacterium]|nr:SDR family oxidoreductase [Planctomycetota bacterium]